MALAWTSATGPLGLGSFGLLMLLVSLGLIGLWKWKKLAKIKLPFFQKAVYGYAGVLLLLATIWMAGWLQQLGVMLTSQAGTIAPTGAAAGPNVQQTAGITATFYVKDALNKSSGARYYDANIVATSSGLSTVKTNVTGSAGGSAGVTYDKDYTVFAEPTGTTYGDEESLNTRSNQPSRTFEVYAFEEPQLALYNVINLEYVNTTFDTNQIANLTQEVIPSTLVAGGVQRTFQIKFQLPSTYTVFGDPREQGPVEVCTNANTADFEITTSATKAGLSAIANNDNMKTCWVLSDYLSSSNTGTGVFQFTIRLKDGRSFSDIIFRLYDKTSFLDLSGEKAGHDFNNDQSSVGDVGAANPDITVTQ